MGNLLWMAGKAFFVALVLTPIVRDIFRSFNVVDRPGKRKVHAHPVPRVGGLAIAAAYGLAMIPLSGPGNPLTAAHLGAWVVIPAASIVLAVGLLDDLFSLKPALKLAGLVVAASVAFWSGLRMGDVAFHSLPLWIDYLLTVFWLVLAANALNLIDGLDGLCAGMGMLSSLALFTAAMLHHNMPLAYATFPLAAALAGFLCYNFNPATVFLGDSGALLIGFLLGSYGMFWSYKGSTVISLLVPLLALSIPLLDVSLSVLRRLIRRQPIFAADRGHIHHRLIDRGLSTRQAVWVLYLVGALAAAFALLASTGVLGRYQGVLIVLFCAAAWLGIHKLRYPEFHLAQHLLFEPAPPAAESGTGLDRLALMLENAATEAVWWDALVREGQDLGFAAIRWSGPDGVRQEVMFPGAGRGWSLQIPLPGGSAIVVEGRTGSDTAACDLSGLAEVIGRTCPVKGSPPHKTKAAAAGIA